MPPPKDDLHRLFDSWVASDLKAQILVFFHNNPGVVETVEGLARRMGTSAEAMRTDVADHVSLGVLRSRVVGGKTVLLYNRAREDEIRRFIEEKIRAKHEGVNT